MLYAIKEDSKLICQLCLHHCHIKNGHTGLCGINANAEGQFVPLTYGYPSTLHIDPIEKKPLYHFLPQTTTLSLGTVGCNFQCPFCQNWGISQTHTIEKNRFVSPQNIVDAAMNHQCRSISFTYNEPAIFYPYAKDIALLAHDAGLKTVFVSNGFESRPLLADMVGIIDAANIDLKSFNPHYYKTVLKGDLEGVKETIRQMKRNGLWIEVTTLVIPSVNDSDEELRGIARFLASVGRDIPWHLSTFFPNYKMTTTPTTPYETLERAYRIGQAEGLMFIYKGNQPDPNATRCPICHSLHSLRQRFAVIQRPLQWERCPQCHIPLPGVWS